MIEGQLSQVPLQICCHRGHGRLRDAVHQLWVRVQSWFSGGVDGSHHEVSQEQDPGLEEEGLGDLDLDVGCSDLGEEDAEGLEQLVGALPVEKEIVNEFGPFVCPQGPHDGGA